MARRPLYRYLPADAADDYDCVWYQLTLERVAENPPRTPRRQLQVSAVAQWATIWRLCEAAIAERLSVGGSLSDIAEAGGITPKGLRQLRRGLLWVTSPQVV